MYKKILSLLAIVPMTSFADLLSVDSGMASSSSGGSVMNWFFGLIIVVALGYYIYQYYSKRQPSDKERNSTSDSYEITRLILVKDIRNQLKEVEELSEKMGDLLKANPEMETLISTYIKNSNTEIRFLTTKKVAWRQRDAERNALTDMYKQIFPGYEK